jgi:uncharacterized protein with HEPN domain
VKDDRIYLAHILDAIHDVEQYASVGRSVFMLDKMRQDAVIRKLEITVKNLSESTKMRRPEIAWRRIAGMRDRLTHDYFGVDLALVWITVDREVPKLKTAVTHLLSGL